MKTLLSITAVTTALTAGAFSLPVLAGDDFSAEEIQQLVNAGDDGRWVYEVKWLDEEGRRHETEIDANTGKWLDDDIKKR